MTEFRYQGITVGGRPLQGVISAGSRKTAEKRIKDIAKEKGIKITSIQKKNNYIYEVKKDNEKYVKGEQYAYSLEEVEKALLKMGYHIKYVQRKLLNFNIKPPVKDIVM